MPALPLTVQPDYGVQLELETRVREITLGEGYSQAVIKGPNVTRQQWTLSWTNISASQELELRNFFRELGSGYVTWTPPNEEDEIRLRPLEPYRASEAGYEAWKVDIRMRQCFDV